MSSISGLERARKDASNQLKVMTAFQRELKKRLKKYAWTSRTSAYRDDIFHEAEEALFKVLNS